MSTTEGLGKLDCSGHQVQSDMKTWCKSADDIFDHNGYKPVTFGKSEDAPTGAISLLTEQNKQMMDVLTALSSTMINRSPFERSGSPIRTEPPTQRKRRAIKTPTPTKDSSSDAMSDVESLSDSPPQTALKSGKGKKANKEKNSTGGTSKTRSSSAQPISRSERATLRAERAATAAASGRKLDLER